MKWSNIAIGKKIGLGFTLTIVILIILSVINYFGVIDLHDRNDEMLEISDLIQTLALRQIDHLFWTDQLRNLIDSEDVAGFNIEVDPAKCQLGQWLNSEHRTMIEAIIPSSELILQELTDRHQQLHISAVSVHDAMSNNSNSARTLFHSETQVALAQVRGYIDELMLLLEDYRAHTMDEMDITIHSFLDRSIYVPIFAVIIG